MLDLQVLQFGIRSDKGQREQGQTKSVVFASPARIANAAINGFSIGYVDADHHLRGVKIDVSTAFVNTSNTELNVTVNCILSDINFDDPFSAVVDVLVIADRA